MPATVNNKVKILTAAAHVADQRGATHLTLERVAEAADLSKGGLLYHFPNKRALLEGMLDYLMQQTDARIDKHSKILAGQPRALAQAMILAESEQDQNERAMAQALLTAAAEDPELLAPARAKLAQWFKQVQDDDPSGLVLVLAAEGLRFLTMLNLLPGGGSNTKDLYELLLNAARGPAA